MSNRVNERLFAERIEDHLGRLIGYRVVDRKKLKYRTAKNPDPFGYNIKPTTIYKEKKIEKPKEFEPVTELPKGLTNHRCFDQVGICYE